MPPSHEDVSNLISKLPMREWAKMATSVGHMIDAEMAAKGVPEHLQEVGRRIITAQLVGMTGLTEEQMGAIAILTIGQIIREARNE